MPHSFDFLAEHLDSLERSSRLRRLVPRDCLGASISYEGKTFTNFGSNDYLGLASRTPPESLSSGGGSSSLVCGWTSEHQLLADRIASLESTESAVVFPSGFAACSGVVATLPGKDDLILSDQLNHASLIDGCRLSRADRMIYPHRDVAILESILVENRHRYRNAWIVTDGVFSMDGHVAPLVQICDVAERYAAIVIVDEAHGTGVLGDWGGGVCESLGVKARVPIRVGTLSKAIGSQGGFVAGPQTVVDYLINHCRSLIYSTSLSPVAVAVALRGLEAIGNEPQRRHRVRQLASSLRSALAIETESFESEVPIVPWIVGSDANAVRASARLAETHLFVPAIRVPTVPDGSARLRISLSADHTDKDIERLVEAIKTCLPR